MKSLWVVGAIFAGAPWLDAAPNLVIRDFQVTYPAPGKIRLMMTAEGREGVAVGSFIVRVSEVLPRRELTALPGLELVSHQLHVLSHDFKGKPGYLLKDNGRLDEDPRPGVFATTIATTRWPAGRYFFNMFAVSTPHPGSYYFLGRAVSFDVGQPQLENEEPNLPGAEHLAIWHQENVYACHPSLTQLDDGRLATRFRAKIRPGPFDPSGEQITLVSGDGGRRWQRTDEPLLDPANRAADGRRVAISIRASVGGITPADGEGWNYAPAAEAAQLKKEKRTVFEAKPGLVAWSGNEVVASTSSDGGKTWATGTLPIPRDITNLTIHRIFRTRSGAWLVSLHGLRRLGPDDRRYPEVFFLRSADDAKTWDWTYLTPEGMRQPSPAPARAAVTELPNGDLLTLVHTSERTNLLRSFSKDGGKTWSYPDDTGIWGGPADLTVLPDGRVLCVYGYNRPPRGIRMCVSCDQGRTWDTEHEWILRSDGLTARDGENLSARIVQLPHNELFAIYHLATDGKMPGIAGTRFTLPAAPR